MGSANGEAKISELVLNDDIRTQINGTMTRIDQMIKTAWEKPVTALSPAVPGASPDSAGSNGTRSPGGAVGTAPSRDLCHSPTSLFPPKIRFTANTRPAYARVMTASTTPIAQA